jgi:hypothetical protein
MRVDAQNWRSMRPELLEAIRRLPPPGREGLEHPKHAKALALIEEQVAANEEMVEVCALVDVKAEETLGGSRATSSGRVLLITDRAIYELIVNKHSDVRRIPLERIYDAPRTRTERHLLTVGRKIKKLYLEEQRGGHVETRLFCIDGDELTLEFMAAAVARAMSSNAQRIEGAVRAHTTPTAPPVADELRKLARLRDDGVLTPAEFETQKARLLQ